LNFSLFQRVLAEFLGVAGIVAVVLGTSHMADALAADATVGLLINALATGAVLFVLISLFAPVSGAQFNPIVTFVLLLKKAIGLGEAFVFVIAQVLGGFAGAVLANLMFTDSVLAVSSNQRAGLGIHLGEVVASFGLVLLILVLLQQHRSSLIPVAVPAWIIAGYFFTVSTSFANPAVTLGRAFSDTGSSIAWSSVPMFILMQFLGALLAMVTAYLLKPKSER
jgi:glycerol uptake facilitator-like aquaporin